MDPPGRPIMAQINSFISSILVCGLFYKPFVQKLPSYIRDSTDFINKVSELRDLPHTVLLLTLDVSSLYTNITHDKGLDALRFYLEEHDAASSPPSNFVVEMASYVLKYNYFNFNNDFYLKVSGSAIFAPNYANLFMGHFEHRYCILILTLNSFSCIMKWYRYINGILLNMKTKHTKNINLL